MRPTIGCLIRFKDSATTLPRVLERLQAQTIRPTVILGVDSGSSDGSAELIKAAGGEVISWHAAYNHPAVINFGIQHLHTDFVLILSSHTTLEDDDALERMAGTLEDPRVACVSAKWDDDPFYSDRIAWDELRTKGLKFCSIFSNSMGMIRRESWVVTPFDETLATAEDYAWAVEQVKRGRVCRRLGLHFNYQRSGHNRNGEFANIVFQIARHHKLGVAWLGVRRSLTQWLTGIFSRRQTPHYAHLKAWFGQFIADTTLIIGIETPRHQSVSPMLKTPVC
ncbi:MAG: glycosyltransferase family 2 protein [Prosthecobacter sp.]|uniref:glycosyltransferase family 2 protein n=1 Tax=Prosthecobacter sp. TaxID=1965333 RepID=UPI003902D3CB